MKKLAKKWYKLLEYLEDGILNREAQVIRFLPLPNRERNNL